MEWRQDGPNAIMSTDGRWRIHKRHVGKYKAGTPEYTLNKAERIGSGVWNGVEKSADHRILMQHAEAET